MKQIFLLTEYTDKHRNIFYFMKLLERVCLPIIFIVKVPTLCRDSLILLRWRRTLHHLFFMGTFTDAIFLPLRKGVRGVFEKYNILYKFLCDLCGSPLSLRYFSYYHFTKIFYLIPFSNT